MPSPAVAARPERRLGQGRRGQHGYRAGQPAGDAHAGAALFGAIARRRPAGGGPDSSGPGARAAGATWSASLALAQPHLPRKAQTLEAVRAGHAGAVGGRREAPGPSRDRPWPARRPARRGRRRRGQGGRPTPGSPASPRSESLGGGARDAGARRRRLAGGGPAGGGARSRPAALPSSARMKRSRPSKAHPASLGKSFSTGGFAPAPAGPAMGPAAPSTAPWPGRGGPRLGARRRWWPGWPSGGTRAPAEGGGAPAPRPVTARRTARRRATRGQIRALWVDAFHEGIKTPSQVRQLIADAHLAGVNTLIVQVRRRGDAYYNRTTEPAPTIRPCRLPSTPCRPC